MFLVLHLWFSMIFRLALISCNQAEVPVNWCPALGTVLANEEVVDGVSERGGYPVIRKVCCRICGTCSFQCMVAKYLYAEKSYCSYPFSPLFYSQCASGC